MRALLALLLLAPTALAVVAPAYSYLAVDDDCRLDVVVHHVDAADATSALRMKVVVSSLAPDASGPGTEHTCGPYTGIFHCRVVEGTRADGFRCVGPYGLTPVLVGGIRDAPSPAPGAFVVPLRYYGHALDATTAAIP